MQELLEKSIEYEAPIILTYTEDEILDELGPAQASLSSYEVILPIFK
jgi:hypothetical protein